jgi:hypothetical protein
MKKSSPGPMIMTCIQVGRRKGAEEVVVIWADSVALVWFV